MSNVRDNLKLPQLPQLPQPPRLVGERLQGLREDAVRLVSNARRYDATSRW